MKVADGHDIGAIVAALNTPHEGKPLFVCCETHKGHGVSFMEDQVGWHGKAPSREEYEKRLQNWGCRTMAEGKSLRIAYGEELCELGKENSKGCRAGRRPAGATITKLFKAQYPERFFDFGIAEANMVCAAAGMAHEGLVPLFPPLRCSGRGVPMNRFRNSVAMSMPM